jgi:hypothetical protein
MSAGFKQVKESLARVAAAQERFASQELGRENAFKQMRLDIELAHMEIARLARLLERIERVEEKNERLEKGIVFALNAFKRIEERLGRRREAKHPTFEV